MPDDAASVPLHQRRKLLRAFRKQYGITLTELGKRADLSNPMLSQFENGNRDLSAEAWTRVLAVMSNLITEDNAKRLAEITKAKETAAKLGAPGLDPVGEIIFGKWIFGLGSGFKTDEQIANAQAEIDAEKARLEKTGEIVALIGSQVEQQAQELLGTTEAGEALQRKVTEHIANEIAPKLFQQCKALTEWRQKILDLEAQGCAFFRKSDVEEKDRRIAELEEQVRALKAKESNG